MPDAVTRNVSYITEQIRFHSRIKPSALSCHSANAFAAGIRPREAALLGMAALHSSVTSKITVRYVTKG
jgi:hypothetical protein